MAFPPGMGKSPSNLLLFDKLEVFFLIPVNGHGSEVQNACSHGDDCHEVVDGTVNTSKSPFAITHVDVVEDAVQNSHQQV